MDILGFNLAMLLEECMSATDDEEIEPLKTVVSESQDFAEDVGIEDTKVRLDPLSILKHVQDQLLVPSVEENPLTNLLTKLVG